MHPLHRRQRPGDSPATVAGRLLAITLVGLLVAALAGCGNLPPGPPPPPSQFLTAPVDAPLSQLAATVPAGRSAFRAMLYSADALQTRLDLIGQARSGIDIQTYLLGDDATGHQLMRALRDAAARGVRVRLLVDDLYTAGMSDLLLGLAAYPGMELRLYNPFPAGRDSWLLRSVRLLGDFSRLNRRMHNKLFIADGRAAVVGGRNLADAYFMRSDEGNFIDFDLLCTGVVVPELAVHFDAFWNSSFAVPVQALADNGLDTAARQTSFDRLSSAIADGPAQAPRLPIGPMGPTALMVADARVFFDTPEKTAGQGGQPFVLPVASLLNDAHERVVIVSPYFLPSEAGLDRMRAARERGVTVQVVTNSLVDSDEPLVSVAYGRRRMALLQSGIRLFELSSERLHQRTPVGQSLGTSVGRLHAKLGFIDDHLMLVGSMNLDPRSATQNTELALVIDSPELTRQVLDQLAPTRSSGVYEVRLADDGQSVEWVAGGGADSDAEHLRDEPAPPWWQRFKLWLLSHLVPDDLL